MSEYRIFKRTWWRFAKCEHCNSKATYSVSENACACYDCNGITYSGDLEPEAGEKDYFTGKYEYYTRAQARNICQEYNEEHAHGKLSLKAEFEEA